MLTDKDVVMVNSTIRRITEKVEMEYLTTHSGVLNVDELVRFVLVEWAEELRTKKVSIGLDKPTLLQLSLFMARLHAAFDAIPEWTPSVGAEESAKAVMELAAGVGAAAVECFPAGPYQLRQMSEILLEAANGDTTSDGPDQPVGEAS